MTYFPVADLGESIVGADLFHDSVRNEKRWDQVASITKAKTIIAKHCAICLEVIDDTNEDIIDKLLAFLLKRV